MTTETIKRNILATCLSVAIILFVVGLNNFAFAAENGSLEFSWLPNTETDLAGYKIRYGTSHSGPYDLVADVGNPSPVDGRIKGSVSGLSEGVTYYFVATAYNESGLESDFSDEVVYTYTLSQNDTTPPEGTISIAWGAASTTNTLVLLTLAANDTESEVAQMKFSNNNVDWSVAENYGTSKSWTLSSGSGIKTVYVNFQDEAGNWSSSYSDTIILTDEDESPSTPSGLHVISID